MTFSILTVEFNTCNQFLRGKKGNLLRKYFFLMNLKRRAIKLGTLNITNLRGCALNNYLI